MSRHPRLQRFGQFRLERVEDPADLRQQVAPLWVRGRDRLGLSAIVVEHSGQPAHLDMLAHEKAGSWQMGAQARALESRCHAIQTPLVGSADWSPAVDINRGGRRASTRRPMALSPSTASLRRATRTGRSGSSRP